MMLEEVVKIIVFPLLVFYPIMPLYVIDAQNITLDWRMCGVMYIYIFIL